MNLSQSTWLPHIVAILVVVIWGSTFVFTKLLLINGLTAAHIFTLRFIIAYVLLLAFSLSRNDHRWMSRSWRDELVMLGLGLTGGSLYFLTENESLNYTTTTNTSLIVCCCPLVAAVLIGLFYKSQRLRASQIAGLLLSALGVSAVVLNGHFVLHLSPLGDMLALAANFCWAIYSLLMIPVGRSYSTVFITRKVFFYGLLTMIPYYVFVPDMPSADVLLRPQVIGNLLFLGCVASMFCFLAWTWVMNRLGAVIATNYVYINPVATIVFASIILNERITSFFIFGTFLILLGMYLADRKG